MAEAGFVDENTHHWTGKDGVNSAEDFLNSPKAQEKAVGEFLKVLWDKTLKTNGARNREGQVIDGVKQRFTVTKSGLLAAAHRQGPRAVKNYLIHLQSQGWKSDPRTFGKPAQRKAYLAIETRLREFSTVPFNK